MFYVALMNGLFFLRYASAGQERLRRQLYWIVLFSLFGFSAFRWEVGCDWIGYWHQFWMAGGMNSSTSLLDGREGLWWGILGAMRGAGLAHPWANVFTSFVFFVGVHFLARRQPDSLAFLVFLFPILIINMPMSAIRQGAAIGIMCFAYVAFIDRRPLRFVAITLLASLMHSSAVIFVLFTPLAMGAYSNWRLLLVVLLVLPAQVILGSTAGGEVAISRYVDTGREAFGGVFRALLLAATGLYFLFFLRHGWRRVFPEDYALAHVGALTMIGVLGITVISSIIGDRIGYYLVPIQAMIFARLPWLPLTSFSKLHIALPYLTLVVFFGAWTSLSFHFQTCYQPYSSWITGMPAEAYDVPRTISRPF